MEEDRTPQDWTFEEKEKDSVLARKQEIRGHGKLRKMRQASKNYQNSKRLGDKNWPENRGPRLGCAAPQLEKCCRLFCYLYVQILKYPPLKPHCTC